MRRFAAGEFVLASTTVIEVASTCNASVMVIEHAERFGLSAHQLRGRVGRGAHQCIASCCISINLKAGASAAAGARGRPAAEIAERDLRIARAQISSAPPVGLPTLRTGDLLRDHSLMERARDEAVRFLDEQTLTAPIVERMKAAWPHRFGLMDIG
jgi:ATP-dependent DNA helicase RecG